MDFPTDEQGLLHFAAVKGYTKAVIYLINRGADINERSEMGFTPLHFASSKAVVNALVDRGADIHARDDRQMTPLHLAVVKCFPQAITALIDRGAEVNAKDVHGTTPLHLAAVKGFTYITNALIDRGADINIRDNRGRSPLHYAVMSDNEWTVNALIDRGAKIDARDRQGRTPLFTAIEFGHEGESEILIRKILTQNFNAQKPNYLADASSTFWDMCKNKIEGKIGNTNISYLDLLKAGENKVVKYVTNLEIRNILSDLEYHKFPVFGRELKNKFCEGMKRRELIDDGKIVIERFRCGSNITLNSDVSEKIAFYLPNSDLKKLKDVGDNNKNNHVEPSTKMDEMREEQGVAGNERKMRIKKRTHQEAFFYN